MRKIGNSEIWTPSDTIEKQKKQLKEGKVKGTTTYNKDLDKCWTWRKQEGNIWTGYANEGKSLFLRQASLIKCLEEGWKAAFAAPEDFPVEDFFDDMIHTLTGKTTDKDYPNLCSEEEYDTAYKLIKDLFYFVYTKAPHNTVEEVLGDFETLCKEVSIDICVIDPLVKFARPKNIPDRDDIYASHVGQLATDFARRTKTSFHLVMHQLTPPLDSVSKNYPEPSMYRVKGGGSWADGFDNVLSVWRPNYATDKLNTEVQFASQKIKKQKLVGIPQKMRITFDRKANRYTSCDFPNDSIFDFDKFMPKPQRSRIPAYRE